MQTLSFGDEKIGALDEGVPDRSARYEDRAAYRLRGRNSRTAALALSKSTADAARTSQDR